MPEPQVGSVAEPVGRRQQRRRHHRHPERRAPDEEQDRGLRPLRGQECVAAEGGDHGQVVQHRGEGRQKEAPVGVQEADTQRPETVEQDLDREDPKEQHRELRGISARIAAPAGREPDDGPREDYPQRHRRGEHRQDHGEHRAHELAGVLLAFVGEAVNQDRDGDGREQPAHEQLVYLIGQCVREGVGVRHHAGAQRRRLGHRAQKACDPGQRSRHRHGDYGL